MSYTDKQRVILAPGYHIPLRYHGAMTEPTPTQVRRPWRATIRTAFQAALALATLIPFVVSGVYGDAETPALVTQVVLVAAAVSRVMALPQVEVFLRTFAPFLSAAPKEN
jgi:hypothetical protein